MSSPWPWLEGQVLGLGLEGQVLGLGLACYGLDSKSVYNVDVSQDELELTTSSTSEDHSSDCCDGSVKSPTSDSSGTAVSC